jgi:protein-L-isoaspartate O-methyltransferase
MTMGQWKRMPQSNVHLTTGDGRLGWPCFAPYDRVVAWCSVDAVPQAWLDQTSPDAILVVPMRSGERHWIGTYHQSERGCIEKERFAGSFIPATATPFHP